MQVLGRLMQRLGLFLPLLAMVLQIMQLVSVGQMLLLLVAGVLAFMIGRLVEGYSIG